MKSLLLSLFLTTLSGGLYALAYPSFIGSGWMPLIFIAFPFFLWRLEVAPNLKSSLLHILSFNLGLNLLGYYWIPHTLREFGNLPWLLSIILGVGFTLILQPHWFLYLIWKRFRPSYPWFSERGILITAFVMTLLERYSPQQFPSFAGSPWLHQAPYLGLAPFFGVAIFSFMTYWVSLEVFTQLLLKKMRPAVWVAFIIFIIVNALMPLTIDSSRPKLKARIVQANIGNFLKIESEKGNFNSFTAVREKYQNLSTLDNGFSPELIIWPETAYPDTFQEEQKYLSTLFKTIMDKTQAEILIGGYIQDKNKSPYDLIESIFNASILLDKNGIKASYHKNILIPFGETLPFGPLNERIVSFVPAVSLFGKGNGTPKLELKSGERFITPICYELLDSNFIRSLLNQWGENSLIINHTNDSWYGDTAEPFQHLFLSKWRALEFGLPIIRSTNTGISSVIYPDGSESRRLGIGEEDVLDVEVTLGNKQGTIYQKYGIYPLVGLFLILLGIVSIRIKKS